VTSELEDARKLAHGTYNDVIVAEHRRSAGYRAALGATSEQGPAVHVVLELPEGSRVIDWAETYEIDGVDSSAAPRLGTSYRLIVGPPTGHSVDGPARGSLHYETRSR